MSLHTAAQHLASKGRGPDTELIHMTKGEIAGLQALAKAHGGSLTVNPHTGLAEAGFLQAILPMALGAGLAAATGGTSLALTPGMIGLGLGGLETLRTGNLMKGLTMGLGAYGGAGLAGGLAGLGTSEAGANLSQANEAAMAKLGPDASARDILMARDAAPAMAMAEAPMQTGFNAAVSDPSKLAASMGGWGNVASAAGAAAAPAISDAMAPKPIGMAPVEGDTDMGPRYRFDPGVANPFPQANAAGAERNYYPNQKYTQLSEADAKALYGFADGGNVQFPYGESVMRMAQGGTALNSKYRTQLNDNIQSAYSKAQDKNDKQTMQALEKEQGIRNALSAQSAKGLSGAKGFYDMPGLYAAGGLSDLGGYSDGGRLLRGPGDGVSDSIPAQIGGKQPARLADGEFVVPARIVSELGNGSTDAGARQLYKMMDRVQKARGKTVGKDKMAKNSNAAKYLPA